jgi:hypothetical protein
MGARYATQDDPARDFGPGTAPTLVWIRIGGREITECVVAAELAGWGAAWQTAAAVVCGLLGSAGCDRVECDDSTVAQDGRCTAVLAPTCGEGTQLLAGQCASLTSSQCGSGTYLEDGECKPDLDLMGNAGRYVLLTLTQPSILGDLLGASLQSGYAEGDLLMFIGFYDPLGTGPRLFGGPGLSVPPILYDLDRAQAYSATATQSGDRVDGEPVDVVLPLTTDSSLILADTTISNAELETFDRVRIVIRGDFAGVIRPLYAEAVTVSGLSLRDVLETSGVAPDEDHDGDGVDESWTLIGHFEAEPVWLF